MELFFKPLLETLTMVGLASLISVILGFPLGIILVTSDERWLRPNYWLNRILNVIINIFRSTPFFILIIILLPISMFLLGTKIGTKASILPLSLAASPFVARLVESSLKEVDKGLVEMGQSLGASDWEIISKILIVEALPSLVSDLTLTVVNLIGLSAMAGAIGGGGLGDLAMRYGYFKLEAGVMIIAVIIIVILVQIVEKLGNFLYRKLDKKQF